MSYTATATMTSAIPQRPSKVNPPPTAPPNAPLPALPVARTRKPLPDIPDAPDSRPTSAASSIAAPSNKPVSRSVTTSSLPTPRPVKTHSTPAIPTLSTTSISYMNAASTGPSPPGSALPTPGKTVRKTTSVGSLPAPPNVNARVNSLPPSPLSASTSTSDINGLAQKTKRESATKHRNSEGGLKKTKTRSSGYGLRSRASAGSSLSFSASPSLLNGNVDNNLISSGGGGKGADGLLGLPSPPQSRRSSAYDTDTTQFEDVDDAVERGRPKSQETITDGNSKGKDSKGNVIVSVRVRPEGGGDGTKPEGEWMVDGRRSLIAYNGREGGDYRYDNVFSPHDNNSRVYDNAAKRLVRRVMEGYHGTVFAYGMTGTGKTFSMQGTATSPGVIPLAITDIFSYIRENPNREFLLRVSYLEIYNEKIHDLLSQSTPGVVQEQDIKLREDGKRGVYATPLKEEIVQSPNQLLRVIARGDLARRTAGTQYNARSSRSHAVVQIVVESRARAPSHGEFFEKEQRRADRILPGGVLVSTLSLIDLAGSEKAAENKERRTEGAHINKSLLTLGTVIGRLSGEDEKEKEDGAKPTEKDTENKDAKLKHLPYRDSKLTRLLQPALSGNSLVSILCTIQLSSAGTSAAAAGLHTGETLNTLKFASRAKNNIVSHAKRNESNPNAGDPGSRALLDRYRLEIQELRQQLVEQNKAKEEAEKEEEIERDRKMEEELERAERIRHEEQILEMQLARTALKERISHLNRLILSSKSIGVNSGSGRLSSLSLISMPPANRISANSTNEFGRPVSVRSRESVNSLHSPQRRDSDATLEVPLPNGQTNRGVSIGSIIPGNMAATPVTQLITEESGEFGDEEESPGADDQEASLIQQNRMLQADLSDKNRYIATLEKRLLQARRTSHSRVSMQLASRQAQQDGNAAELLLREKDKEIDDLRAKLDDQTRMVNALRSATRKRDLLDNRHSASVVSEGTARPSSANLASTNFSRKNSSRLSSRSSLRLGNMSGSGHVSKESMSTTSRSSGGPVNFSKTPLSPMALLSPTGSDHSEDPLMSPTGPRKNSKTSRRKSVDEMTMLLDQMIQDKVDSGHVVRGERGSLRIKRDTVMERNGTPDAILGAENGIQEVDETELKESDELKEQEEES